MSRTRVLVVAALAFLGYVLSPSFWAAPVWAAAVLVAINPLVAATRRLLKNADEDPVLLAGPGDCDVIVAGRARATAALVLSQALGIERAEAFGRLRELPAVAATGLTEDQARELVRRLRHAKVAASYRRAEVERAEVE
ncbi:hypothetical protein ACQPZJ_24140 [Actinoplanes sp. CA-054009]